MITPAATYVQYQRKFANVPYVWNMSESDITELEVILSDIASVHTSGDVSVELLAPDDGTDDVRNVIIRKEHRQPRLRPRNAPPRAATLPPVS